MIKVNPDTLDTRQVHGGSPVSQQFFDAMDRLASTINDLFEQRRIPWHAGDCGEVGGREIDTEARIFRAELASGARLHLLQEREVGQDLPFSSTLTVEQPAGVITFDCYSHTSSLPNLDKSNSEAIYEAKGVTGTRIFAPSISDPSETITMGNFAEHFRSLLKSLPDVASEASIQGRVLEG